MHLYVDFDNFEILKDSDAPIMSILVY